jgi:hypothetical protein
MNASVLTAATTLVEWAHVRRRRWTDEPLARPEARAIREVQEVREVLDTLWVPETPVSGLSAFPEVPEIPEIAEDFEIPPAPGVREIWEASGVLGVPEKLEPEPVPSFQNTEVLSLAADITPWPAADTRVAAPDLPAHVEAPRAKWADFFGRLNFKSLLPRVKWPAVLSRRERSTVTTERTGESVSGLSAALLKTGRAVAAGLERVRPLGEPSVRWLTRGAALVSATSVLIFVMVNRADLFSGFDRSKLVSSFQQIDVSSHLDRVKKTVTAAANAGRPAPPPVRTLPPGVGQLTITSSDDNPMVIMDGKTRGKTPLTILLPAGTHHMLLRSTKGSIEKTIRVDAGESAELDESIFPGWVAVSAAVDLTLRENGRTLKRDERGWAMLSPGPHEIHLDNDQLGIHETRKVVVTPGDTTRLLLAPQTSTLSITANEPAEVWIDGTSVGQAPITEAQMTLGTHDVRLRSASHERWLHVRVTLNPVELNVDMTAE